MKLVPSSIMAIFLLISCNSSNNTTNLKQINSIDMIVETDGFWDLPFTIVEQTNTNGYLSNKIQAITQNDTLELLISLKEGVPPGFVNGVPKNMFLEEGIIFESTGSKSNKLLNVLAQKYGLNQDDLSIKEKQIFTCANLNQEPIDYKKGTPKFKIFLEDETQSAELFVNFDFKNSIISLSEKDPEYRSSLINLMKK